MRKSLPLVFISVAILGLFSPASAALLFEDHFSDGVLDSGWSISLGNVSGWNYSETGTNLVVTDIQSQMTPGEWSTVYLRRNLPGLNDFNIHFEFSWDSEDTLAAMQQLYVYLYDANNNVIGLGGYGDAWINERGVRVAQMDEGSGARYAWSPNELGFSGSASYDINRTIGGGISYSWNNDQLLSGVEHRPLSRVEVRFDYRYHNGDPNDSIFGTESLDLIRVDSATFVPAPVPVPSTILLLGSGLVGLVGLRRKLKK